MRLGFIDYEDVKKGLQNELNALSNLKKSFKGLSAENEKRLSFVKWEMQVIKQLADEHHDEDLFFKQVKKKPRRAKLRLAGNGIEFYVNDVNSGRVYVYIIDNSQPHIL